MHFTTLTLTAFLASLASAAPAPAVGNNNIDKRVPATLRPRQLGGLCPGIDSPLCCQTDVDGIVDLTCESPSSDPATTAEFSATCAETGLTAECCTLPLAGDALLCTAV